MTSVNPRSITEVERPFVTGKFTVEEQADLIDRVRELGYADNIALALAGWLARKAAGHADHASQDTRARYRAILRQVAERATMVDGVIPGYLKVADQTAHEAA